MAVTAIRLGFAEVDSEKGRPHIGRPFFKELIGSWLGLN